MPDRAGEIAREALGQEPGEREAFIAAACGEDETLRQQVELRLLFDTPAGAMEGRRIGPYQILHKLGGGGMGSVYLAARADEQFEKRVAIKVLEAGRDNAEILERFRAERQTLAALDHPNIVRILDGGTTEDGLPYLVMDYVDGVPLIEYAKARRLPLRQRLEMFRVVCAAVHYAHQNLVIHRDLKPGNILVAAEGAPKLLDFGIAKLLKPGFQEQPGDTGKQARPLTLAYASPEQVRFGTITIATDVYSLGVVLYELLSGRSPYTLKEPTMLAMVYAITNQQPAPLGEEDVDAILKQAMRKDPQQRYPSVEQFSEDIRRRLEGLPVTAHPPALGYRARKFVLRYRWGVAGAGAAAVLALAGMMAIVWQGRVAEAQRVIAERRFRDLRDLANSFLFEFHDAIRDLPGATPARMLLVKKASDYLDKLSRDAGGDVSLELELVEAYGKLGDVQGNPYVPNLGDHQGALASYRKAVEIAEALARSNPQNAAVRRAVARAYLEVADVLPLMGSLEESAYQRRRAAKILEELAKSGGAQAHMDLARAYDGLGDVLGHSGLPNLGDWQGAMESYRKSLGEWETAAALDRKNQVARRGVAILNMKIADLQSDRGQVKEALETYRKARETMEEFSSANPGNAAARRNLAVIYRKMAYSQSDTGDIAGALANYRAASSILEGLAAADPNNVQARMDLAVTLKNEGDLHNRTGDVAPALAAYGRVVDIVEALSTADPTNLERRGQLSEVLVLVGDLLVRTGQPAEGRRQTLRGMAIMKQLAERAEATPADLQRYADALVTAQPTDVRNPSAAVRFAEQAVDRTKASDPVYLDTLAQAYYLNGEAARAIQIEEQALALRPGPVARTVIENHLGKFRK